PNAELQQVAVRVPHVKFSHAPFTVGDRAELTAVVRSDQSRVQSINVVDPEIGRRVLGDAPLLARPEMNFDVVAGDDGKAVLGVETIDREAELVTIPPAGLADVSTAGSCGQTLLRRAIPYSAASAAGRSHSTVSRRM